jgi:hypothetical protein
LEKEKKYEMAESEWQLGAISPTAHSYVKGEN